MIIISLFGGLGNQMFQYACGKALAGKLEVELCLDISLLTDKNERDNFTFRNYELDVFKINEKIADVNTIRKFVPDLRNCTKIDLALYKFIRLVNGNHYYFEKQKFQVESEFKRIKDKTYLYGYFQSEDYFSEVKKEICSAFSLKKEPDLVNLNLIERISNENAVSLHIRRGDYHNSPFNLLDITYYQKAIEHIKKNVQHPVFYIFTNDYEWAKKNLESLNIEKTILNHNQGENSYLDLVLMSKCKHNICANSSFSWWGAWLNPNPQKIVITPSDWFKDKSYVESTFDLIPDNWLRI